MRAFRSSTPDRKCREAARRLAPGSIAGVAECVQIGAPGENCNVSELNAESLLPLV
jgi:hypothetical protein